MHLGCAPDLLPLPRRYPELFQLPPARGHHRLDAALELLRELRVRLACCARRQGASGAAAAELLLQSLSTFTATELFSYRRFIFYTVVVSVVALDRVTLRAKVVDAPEILTVIADIPHAAPLLNGLYECKYAQYMDAYQRLAGTVAADWVLARHARYFAREARLVAYAQFLESYKTVTLARMAEAFGVGADFMDAEVAAFIAAGRLPAKIDRVAGILETTRPNVKNAAYQATIKKGDLLLNRLQRLGRVADL